MRGAEHTALGYDSLEASSDIAAFPDSVNSLEGVCGDVRTPDKLIDEVNNTSDGRHMWLAPILPGLVGSSGSQPWGGWGAGGGVALPVRSLSGKSSFQAKLTSKQVRMPGGCQEGSSLC